MIGFDAIHVRIATDGAVIEVQIVCFVFVVECFAKETSESTESETKFAEKFLCFHILCIFIDFVFFV